MNTKLLMGTSALYFGILGALFSFLPHEVLNALHVVPNEITTLTLQFLSAMFLGFAMLNYMSKGARIGGLYNRPVVIANMMYFLVSSITLIKAISNINVFQEVFWMLLIVNSLFAIAFVYLFRTNPK